LYIYIYIYIHMYTCVYREGLALKGQTVTAQHLLLYLWKFVDFCSYSFGSISFHF
jgi:hypothetical protein